MELKKSISDTERALRSYGAVSNTAWTTDKGEQMQSYTAGYNHNVCLLINEKVVIQINLEKKICMMAYFYTTGSNNVFLMEFMRN